MKKAIFTLTMLFFSVVAFGQAELLTNSKIMEMTRAGLEPEIILLKIRSSAVSFDISADALIELKKAGVKDDVISAMVEKGRSTPEAAGPTLQSSNKQPTQQSTLRDALLNAKTIAF